MFYGAYAEYTRLCSTMCDYCTRAIICLAMRHVIAGKGDQPSVQRREYVARRSTPISYIVLHVHLVSRRNGS